MKGSPRHFKDGVDSFAGVETVVAASRLCSEALEEFIISLVQNSLEGWAAGRSIPGFEKNVKKPFLQPLWHK